jgi:hypothetical protein
VPVNTSNPFPQWSVCGMQVLSGNFWLATSLYSLRTGPGPSVAQNTVQDKELLNSTSRHETPPDSGRIGSGGPRLLCPDFRGLGNS